MEDKEELEDNENFDKSEPKELDEDGKALYFVKNVLLPIYLNLMGIYLANLVPENCETLECKNNFSTKAKLNLFYLWMSAFAFAIVIWSCAKRYTKWYWLLFPLASFIYIMKKPYSHSWYFLFGFGGIKRIIFIVILVISLYSFVIIIQLKRAIR